jgi:hypothetical protein
MNHPSTSSVSPLAAALNDRSRTRIGNPRRGTFYVSIGVAETVEATELANLLDLIGVSHQANFKRNSEGRPIAAFLAIYRLDDQMRLLEATRAELDPERLNALETLVAARGPIPPDLVRKLEVSLEHGRTYHYLARKLNELQIVDGMGRRLWTATKLRRKLADAVSAGEAEAQSTA